MLLPNNEWKDGQSEYIATSHGKNELIEEIAAITPDLITIQDVPSQCIIYHNNNDVWKEILDVNVYELAEAGRDVAIIHPDYRELAANFFQIRKLLKDGEVAEIDLALTNDHWIRVRSKIFRRNQEGNASQIISFISDISQRDNDELKNRNIELEHLIQERTFELRQVNESLTLQNLKLKAMNDELKNYAFIASHDVREPIRKIQLYATEVATREADNLSENGKIFTSKIIAAVERLNDLIDDILSYSRMASGPKRKYVETDLNDLLAHVLADLSETIRTSGAKITNNKLPSFKCNQLQITQVFQNLISNAVKFQPGNRVPEVTVTGQIVDGAKLHFTQANTEKNYLKLEVADNGIGIEEKYLEKIFGLFQRLHGRGAYEGTGLGLAICKRIVENHGGFIVAESVYGKGSCFTCFIPIIN
jgi:signal transduction histidine kinase